MNLLQEIEKQLESYTFKAGTWIGYPSIKDDSVYFNAKGRDLDVAKAFRDCFGGTAIAGSVKTISKHIKRKEGGYTIGYSVSEIETMIQEIKEVA